MARRIPIPLERIPSGPPSRMPVPLHARGDEEDCADFPPYSIPLRPGEPTRDPHSIRSFWLPKAGNSTEEYEDALSGAASPAAGRFRYAVADGATEMSFSGAWARLLVEAYCAGNDGKRPFNEMLPVLQETWRNAVGSKPLPWYAEEKVRSGAFSTLLGLTLRYPTSPPDSASPSPRPLAPSTWHCLTIGDSCLFQRRQDRLIRRFPVSHSRDFGNRPVLLSTEPASNAGLDWRLRRTAGYWQPGDVFYLMTDALACWFLATDEAGAAPWEQLDAVGDMTGFAALVHDLRAASVMRNDDVTLMRIEMP